MIATMRAGAALVLVLGLAGCGPSSPGNGVAAAPATSSSATGAASSSAKAAKASTSVPDQGVAYARCMRKHGVNFPDPTKKGLMLNPQGGGPGKVDQRKIDAAMAACRSLQPAGADLAKAPPGAVKDLRKLSKCMRANGVPNFPDPGANGQLVMDKSSGIDPTSGVFKAAQTKCSQYAPAGAHQQNAGPAGGSK